MNTENSISGRPSQCAACGRPLKEEEAICLHCDKALAPKPEQPPSGLSWGMDIFAMIIAQIATIIASVFGRFSFPEMFCFCVFILTILLRRRWQHLSRKQMVIRSVLLLLIGAVLCGLFFGGMLMGCRYLMRNIN